MEYKNSLLIDSSLLIAYFYKQDSNNAKANKMEEQIYHFTNLFITNFIYAEIATVLSQRIGKINYNYAEKSMLRMGITEIKFNEETYTSTKTNFLKVKNKNISFTDINIFTTAKHYGIDTIVSFDKHFKHLSKEYKIKLIGV